MTTSRDPETGLVRRGTTNRNQRGSVEDRRRRKQFLIDEYRADVRGIKITHAIGPPAPNGLRGKSETYFPYPAQFNSVWNSQVSLMRLGLIVKVEEIPCCRCYRCGRLLTIETVTPDRIVPGCRKTTKYPNGGTYVRENIRPACEPCNSETGGALAKSKDKKVVHPEPMVIEAPLQILRPVI